MLRGEQDDGQGRAEGQLESGIFDQDGTPCEKQDGGHRDRPQRRDASSHNSAAQEQESHEGCALDRSARPHERSIRQDCESGEAPAGADAKRQEPDECCGQKGDQPHVQARQGDDVVDAGAPERRLEPFRQRRALPHEERREKCGGRLVVGSGGAPQAGDEPCPNRWCDEPTPRFGSLDPAHEPGALDRSGEVDAARQEVGFVVKGARVPEASRGPESRGDLEQFARSPGRPLLGGWQRRRQPHRHPTTGGATISGVAGNPIIDELQPQCRPIARQGFEIEQPAPKRDRGAIRLEAVRVPVGEKIGNRVDACVDKRYAGTDQAGQRDQHHPRRDPAGSPRHPVLSRRSATQDEKRGERNDRQ